MEILFFIVYSLLAFAYFGWGVYGFCVNRNDDMPTGSLLAFGYALSQVLFFPAYFIFSDSTIAVISLFLLATIFNIAYLYRLKCRGNKFFAGVCARVKQDIPAYIVFAVVIIFAAIPYLFSGFGNHWQTANEDIFDGLNGRNAYINNELTGDSSNLNMTTRTRDTLGESLIDTMRIVPKKDTDFFRERYVDYAGRLQYSSLAFFSVLLFSPTGMDAFLIQALLNLGLFSVGVYVFVCYILHQPSLVAGLTATLSAVGNFYLATYFNGHVGSLMYNAVAPFLLYLMVKWVRDKNPVGSWLIIPIVLAVMILWAYPYPLPYIVVPFVAYFALTWFAKHYRNGEYFLTDLITSRHMLIVGCFLFFIGFVSAFILVEPIRYIATYKFRSWGTMFNHIGILQFWGIWPANLSYSPTEIGWLDSRFDLKLASLFFASILSAISIYGFYRLVKEGIEFITVWIPIALFLFIVMRFAVVDSYYLYKYVYIHAWIVFAATMVGFWTLILKKQRLGCLIASTLLSLWIILNLVNNANAFLEISRQPFHRDLGSYFQLLKVPKHVLEDTFISIPKLNHAELIRHILSDNGIATQKGKLRAKFVLNEVGIKDVVVENIGVIEWESDRFVLSRKPVNDTIELASIWEPEAGSPKLFRWVSDDRYSTVLVDLHDRSENARYLYLCGESGPSVGFRLVEVIVFDADRKKVGVMPVEAYGCHWLDISAYRAPFSITHNEKGQIVSYVDNRKLVFRIMHIGFSRTDRIEALPIEITATLPPEVAVVRDIIRLQATPANIDEGVKIHLGDGWYSFEEYGGESFRWVNKDAEVFISGPGTKGSLVIDVAMGPSTGRDFLQLVALNDHGRIIGSCLLRERMKCILPLALNDTGKTRVLLRSDGTAHVLSSDPRLLNFRVFSLEWEM